MSSIQSVSAHWFGLTDEHLVLLFALHLSSSKQKEEKVVKILAQDGWCQILTKARPQSRISLCEQEEVFLDEPLKTERLEATGTLVVK